MDAAVYVYPWDVVGDDAAAERIAGLGVDHAVVAGFYHATRALTPRHPRHRVVVAERSASYLPVGPAWEQVLPPAQTWIDAEGPSAEDPFGATASALAAAGVPTHAWVVVDHVDAFDAPHVVNAYGDVYPWTLCPSQESVLEYAVGLAAVIAARPDVSGVEFEAAGWYGFDHLHEHDKVAGIPLSDDELYLMSLCFCDACHREYQNSGIEAAGLRALVRKRLDLRFTAADPSIGGSSTGGSSTGGLSTGGPSAGGLSIAGLSTGGPLTGGPLTAGSSTAGSLSGGSSTRGPSAGGLSIAGLSTGGSSAGGSSTGDPLAGGLSTRGSSAGGLSAAGPSSGGLPDPQLAAAVLAMRTRVAGRLREALVREVRTQRDADFPILFHANPRPHRSTAFTGLDLTTFPKNATAIVVNCWDGNPENVTLSTGHHAAVAAGLLGVRGMGAHPERLGEQAAAMRTAGASGIRLYHAGLASNTDLDAMRAAVAAAKAG